MTGSPQPSRENTNVSTPASASSSRQCLATATSVRNHAGPRLNVLPYLVNVRGAASRCGEQVILDVMQGNDYNYTVKYDAVRELTTDRKIAVRGGAQLSVTVAASAIDQSLTNSYLPDNPLALIDATEMTHVRQVVWAGSFEGSSRIGIGLDAQRPFSVQIEPAATADQPSHFVITFG